MTKEQQEQYPQEHEALQKVISGFRRYIESNGDKQHLHQLLYPDDMVQIVQQKLADRYDGTTLDMLQAKIAALP